MRASASVEAIDTAMRLGANHPMGPLQLADFIGLDTCLSIMQVLHEGLADSKYRPCPLLVKYVEAGWLGRKTKPRLLRLPRREAGPDAREARQRGREPGTSEEPLPRFLWVRHRRPGGELHNSVTVSVDSDRLDSAFSAEEVG